MSEYNCWMGAKEVNSCLRCRNGPSFSTVRQVDAVRFHKGVLWPAGPVPRRHLSSLGVGAPRYIHASLTTDHDESQWESREVEFETALEQPGKVHYSFHWNLDMKRASPSPAVLEPRPSI